MIPAFIYRSDDCLEMLQREAEHPSRVPKIIGLAAAAGLSVKHTLPPTTAQVFISEVQASLQPNGGSHRNQETKAVQH